MGDKLSYCCCGKFSCALLNVQTAADAIAKFNLLGPREFDGTIHPGETIESKKTFPTTHMRTHVGTTGDTSGIAKVLIEGPSFVLTRSPTDPIAGLLYRSTIELASGANDITAFYEQGAAPPFASPDESAMTVDVWESIVSFGEQRLITDIIPNPGFGTKTIVNQIAVARVGGGTQRLRITNLSDSILSFFIVAERLRGITSEAGRVLSFHPQSPTDPVANPKCLSIFPSCWDVHSELSHSSASLSVAGYAAPPNEQGEWLTVGCGARALRGGVFGTSMGPVSIPWPAPGINDTSPDSGTACGRSWTLKKRDGYDSGELTVELPIDHTSYLVQGGLGRTLDGGYSVGLEVDALFRHWLPNIGETEPLHSFLIDASYQFVGNVQGVTLNWGGGGAYGSRPSGHVESFSGVIPKHQGSYRVDIGNGNDQYKLDVTDGTNTWLDVIILDSEIGNPGAVVCDSNRLINRSPFTGIRHSAGIRPSTGTWPIEATATVNF